MDSKALGKWNRFTDAVSLMMREFGQNLKEFDLSLMEYRTLARLDEYGPAPMTRLADELLMTRAGTTMLTDRLEGRKLVKRVRREDDRRMIFITLTPKGRKLVSAARKSNNSLIEVKLRNLSGDELSKLVEMVEKLSGKGGIVEPVLLK